MESHGLTETLRETLAVFDGDGAPRTTSEVADELDLGRRSTYDRLERLVDSGRLQTKKVGASARVWWRKRDGTATGSEGSGLALSKLIDNVPGTVYRSRTTSDWPISYISDGVTDLTGYDPETLERGDVSWETDVVHPEDRERLRREVDAQLAVSDVFTAEYRILTREGETRWMRERGCLVEGEVDDGVLEGVITDITEAEQSRRALAERERQFRTLVQETEEYAIFRLDTEGRVQTWNSGAEQLKGYEADEILGDHFSAFYTAEDREAGVPEANLRVAAERGSVEDEGWRVRADGTRFWASVTITAIRNDDGDLVGYAKVTRDMTERRAFERDLERERDLLNSVFDAIPEGVAVLDAAGTPVRTNEQTRRYLEMDDEDDDPEPLADDAVRDEDGEPVPPGERPYDRAHQTGEPVRDWVGRFDLPGAREQWLSVTAVPLTDDEGAVERVVVSAEDVTQLKEQAERLQRSRENLERELDEVLERIDDGFVAIDDEWRFTYVNEQAASLLDRPRSELVGRSIWDEFPEAVGTQFQAEYERAVETNESVFFEAYYPPLKTWFGVSAHPSESGLSVYFRNVTERKERERELERYEAIVETVEDGIYVVDEDGYFTQVNEAYASMVSRSREALVGKHVSAINPDEETLERVQDLEDTLASGETATASLEATLTRPDGSEWVGEAIFSLMETDDGYERVGVVRDVTERKERERELEQYEAVAATASDAIVTVDTSSTIRDVNPAVEAVFGYEPEELLGKPLTTLIPDELTADHFEAVDRYLATGERTLDWEYIELPGVRADGTEISLAISFSEYEHDGDRYFTGIIRDVTEQKAYQRQLEQYERIVETVEDGIYALDEESRYVLVNEAFCELVGYEREELLGEPASILYDESYTDIVEERAAAVAKGEREAAGIEIELIRSDGIRVPVETRYEPLSADGRSRCGVVRDISERLERERELQRRVRQQAVVTDLGQQALEGRDLDALMAEAAERVARTLDNDYCKVLDLDEDEAELLLRQGVGWDDGIVGEAAVSAVEADSQAAYTLQSAGPVVVEDLTTETRFSGPDLLTDHDVRSGISVLIGQQNDPWGILGTHDTETHEYSEHDVNFVQSVATILTTAIERQLREQALMGQREQLAALNSLNEVVRETTDAVLEQSTRDEIEATVCKHLAATDSYEFAWIGEVSTNSETVVSRTEAGVDGYLDDVQITVDPEDEHGWGPAGRALRTGEVQAVQRIQANPRYEPWRETAESYGFSSSAAIPVVHRETTYGVLNVYSARPNAFEAREQAVLGQLGEVVGHAIAATDRKQALLSDEVVELEFGIPDLFEALDLPSQPTGRFSFEDVVDVGDGEFLVYGDASAEAVETIESLVDHLSHLTAVSVTDDEGDTRFELQMNEPPVLSTLASLGGSIEHAVVEDGDYHMTLHLSPTADVRQAINAVQDAYPEATMLRRQQVTTESDRSRPTSALLEDLTDRQRTTLEAAYYAGFFEWPRDASGEDVADSLQVSPPTFHQHLRKAERKVFTGLFGSASG